MAGDSVLYRQYPPTLNASDVEGLFDVDEHYPDIVRTLAGLQSATLFITAWLIVPWIRLQAGKAFSDMLVGELRKPNSRVYILWNTNYNGAPYPELMKIAGALHADVIAAAGASADRFKIILSTNRNFDTPGRLWNTFDTYVRGRFLLDRAKHLVERTNPDSTLPANAAEQVSNLWLKSFPADPRPFKNLTGFTFGSHHQKTVTIIGTPIAGSTSSNTTTPGLGMKILRSYCGGIDFATGPAGYHAARRTYNGGSWWHDSALRVCGVNAVPVLTNFVERWNADLTTVAAGGTLAWGVGPADTLDVSNLTLMNSVDFSTGSALKVERVRTMPLGGVDWPSGMTRETETLDCFRTWIGRCEDRIFIVNQYFRYPPIAELLKAQLDSKVNLRVTIVIPMYTEEIGQRSDLVGLRNAYVAAAVANRPSLLVKVKANALTIDPVNKLTLYAQSRAFKDLVGHARVRVWMPKSPLGTPYIHSKLTMFDTQALLIGSANLNGRSLQGLADSEIGLLLTDGTEITRIRNAQGWHLEPESETASGYAGSWYARHNLVRYTPAHWEVDTEYGAFPKGMAAIRDYATKMKIGGRFDLKGVTFGPTEVESAVNALGVDPDTADLGDLFLQAAGHLL